jgi:hypothetical protein
MAPAVYLALVLLFSPNVIFAEPVHFPLIRRQPEGGFDLRIAANNLRVKYGHRALTLQNSRSERRASNGIPIYVQVGIVIILFYISTHRRNRAKILVTLLICRLAHRKFHTFLFQNLLYGFLSLI